MRLDSTRSFSSNNFEETRSSGGAEKRNAMAKCARANCAIRSDAKSRPKSSPLWFTIYEYSDRWSDGPMERLKLKAAGRGHTYSTSLARTKTNGVIERRREIVENLYARYLLLDLARPMYPTDNYLFKLNTKRYTVGYTDTTATDTANKLVRISIPVPTVRHYQFRTLNPRHKTWLPRRPIHYLMARII